MAKLQDDKDGGYASGRRPGRFYVSRRFPEGGAEANEGKTGDPRMCRFAYQVFDERGDTAFENDQGWDVVLRETATRQQLKAFFFEDDRTIPYITFQRFNADGKRLRSEHFVLSGDEVGALSSFLALIRSRSIDLSQSEKGIRLLPGAIDALLGDDATRHAVFARYRDVFTEMIASDVESPEVIALARRRRELARFEALLTDADAFQAQRSELKALGRQHGPENVWQDFFESNHWIFGTGLAPQFLHAWDDGKLEQTVLGTSLLDQGKRPDALMRTAGALSALVFVEIKSHGESGDNLLHPTAYRKGAWRVHEEVAGGVAQCQATVDAVVRRASELQVIDDDGYKAGDSAFICRPRSLLVIGSLNQFKRDGQPHVSKFESFERFRRSIRDPEIVTFDELYNRAAMSLAITAPPNPSAAEES
ncbi:MAG TPA: Shedu immune nuclease family protein [Acidimicrobiia bacterium]